MIWPILGHKNTILSIISILSLYLFPADVAKLESDYYQTKKLDYGIPLDSRSNPAKADLTSWIAALGDSQQANTIFAKLYKFANESTDRVPFSDIYDVVTGRMLGFHARPVMGGLFARALTGSLVIENDYVKLKRSSKRYRPVNKCNIK